MGCGSARKDFGRTGMPCEDINRHIRRRRLPTSAETPEALLELLGPATLWLTLDFMFNNKNGEGGLPCPFPCEWTGIINI
jgi:hypothetical protein